MMLVAPLFVLLLAVLLARHHRANDASDAWILSEQAASERWATQNLAADAERRCPCGTFGQVRHASQAVGGSYVWWSCWEHRWANGIGVDSNGTVTVSGTHYGPGFPVEGVSSGEYYRWFDVARSADGTWVHADHVRIGALPEGYEP